VSLNEDIITNASMSVNRNEQQIPPLRCAPVGMTDYLNKFGDWKLRKAKQEERPALKKEDRPTWPYIEALVNPS
jgi:hypothetical protein